MTNFNTAHKRKYISTQNHMVENDCATTVTTKWKVGFGKERSYWDGNNLTLDLKREQDCFTR